MYREGRGISCILGIHWPNQGRWQLTSLSFVTNQTFKCNDRLINGLFHLKCVDVHENEKIIILKLSLPE